MYDTTLSFFSFEGLESQTLSAYCVVEVIAQCIIFVQDLTEADNTQVGCIGLA